MKDSFGRNTLQLLSRLSNTDTEGNDDQHQRLIYGSYLDNGTKELHIMNLLKKKDITNHSLMDKSFELNPNSAIANTTRDSKF